MNPNLQTEEEIKFFNSLTDFLINTNRIKANQKDKFQQLAEDLYPLKLYKIVCRRGGFQAVTNRKQWAQISLQLMIKDLLKLKDFYFQYLYPYEQKYYFGKQDEDQYPNLICGHPRKIAKTDNPNSQNTQPQTTSQQQQSQFSSNTQGTGIAKSIKQETHCLEEQITKKFQQQQRQRKIFFLNKNKLNQTKAQTKKIVLGLQAFMDRRDVVYSLNMLMLYSINTHFPFLFQNNQKIFASLCSFASSIYPPKNQEQLEDLRTITFIFRNFTMSPINLKFILGTQIFQLFVKIFNQGFDKQCSRNIIDVMTGLVKVGWDCQRIVTNLDAEILDNQIQTVQSSVQLIRGLVDERQQALFTIIPQNIKTFNRILMNNQVPIQVKEQVFETIAFVSDVSQQARQSIAKNFNFMGIIVKILQNMQNNQKLTQLAALTLNNLSNAMNGKTMIKQYENQLVVIGFTDDSLAGIIANILADIATL